MLLVDHRLHFINFIAMLRWSFHFRLAWVAILIASLGIVLDVILVEAVRSMAWVFSWS